MNFLHNWLFEMFETVILLLESWGKGQGMTLTSDHKSS